MHAWEKKWKQVAVNMCFATFCPFVREGSMATLIYPWKLQKCYLLFSQFKEKKNKERTKVKWRGNWTELIKIIIIILRRANFLRNAPKLAQNNWKCVSLSFKEKKNECNSCLLYLWNCNQLLMFHRSWSLLQNVTRSTAREKKIPNLQ